MGIFNRKPKDVLDSTAEVLFAQVTAEAARQTGKRDLEHEVILRVNRPDGSDEEFGLVIEVPYDKALVIGKDIPVRISASRSRFLEIDFDSMPSLNDIGRDGPDSLISGLGFEKQDET